MKLFQNLISRPRGFYLLLGIILLIAFFLRIYKVGGIPPALYQDETSIGYNAYSINTNLRDEYGVMLPLYFKSFGDQKLPVYIYLTALSERVFGLTPLAIRFPSVLFGTLSVALLGLIVYRVTKDRTLSLISSIFLAFNPWHLHFSRAGFEVNVALFFSLLGIFTFLKFTDNKKTILLILSIVSFCLSLYSYNVTRLLAPLLFFYLAYIHREDLKDLSPVAKVGSILVGGIFVLPFFLSIFSDGGVSSASGALITSADVESKIVELRGYYLGLPEVFTKLFFNKYIYLGWTYINNIIAIFSTSFFFTSGTSHGNQGIGNFGNLYPHDSVLIIVGLIAAIVNKVKNLRFFIWWGLICVLVLALSKEVPHATRGYFLLIPMTVFSSFGFTLLLHKLNKMKLIYKAPIALFASGLVVYSMVFYFTSYFVRFPLYASSSWRTEDKTVSKFIKDNESKYEKIIFDSEAGFVYSSLLFYNKYDPITFQKTVKRASDDSEGFSVVRSFGKYEFREVDWEKDYREGVLIVSTPSNRPANVPEPNFIIRYPTRPLSFSLKEVIVSVPAGDIAYILMERRPDKKDNSE